jgi:hypothetical protein
MSSMFTPTGATTYFRGLITKMVVGCDADAAMNFAASRWSRDWATIGKAAVGAEFASDLYSNEAAAEFVDHVLSMAVIGKMPAIRKVETNTPIMTPSTTTRGYWTTQGNPVPISKSVLDHEYLAPLSVNVLSVHSDRALKIGGKNREDALMREFTRALTDAMDSSFLDPANAGIAGEEPASITNGLTPVSATSDPSADITNLIEGFQGDLLSAAFVTDPVSASKLALARDGGGSHAFPDASIKGGSILGLPLIVSRTSPNDSNGGQLVLVDASGIAMTVEAIEVKKSDRTAIAMSDDPDSPAQMVSMWQTNCTAFLSRLVINWKVVRPGSVSLITGINW